MVHYVGHLFFYICFKKKKKMKTENVLHPEKLSQHPSLLVKDLPVPTLLWQESRSDYCLIKVLEKCSELFT